MSIKPRAVPHAPLRLGQPQRQRQRGVTLIELILFIMIIGVALTAIVGVMNFTTQRSADPVRRKQALMLAEAYLEEVAQARFSFCDVFDANAGDENPITPTTPNCASVPENWGAEPNNERPFDNVNDYVTGANVASFPFTVNGSLLDGAGATLPVSGFTVSVAIAPDTLGGLIPPDPAAPANSYAAARVLRIRVTVGYDGQTLSLEGYRTRYAPNLQ